VAIFRSLSIRNLRGYAALDIEFGPGPQLVWGPNAAGKTTLLEAMVLLALGRSHRTTTDGELIRWGADFLRLEGAIAATDGAEAPATVLEFTLQSVGRKKIQVNGVPRRPAALAQHLRMVLFAPEDMLLVMGPPALRRTALDGLTAPHSPGYGSNVATYTRSLQQRNSLLRAIRDGEGDRDQLRLWDEPFLMSGSAIMAARIHLLELLAEPLAAAHREIAPLEGRLGLTYVANATQLVGEMPRDSLARRMRETSDKEVWNGSTLVGPHRDDLMFTLDGRDLATFSSRGQQRTAILALKLAELDVLTTLDGRPPLLLLDDVFSELDPNRRSHLVRRLVELPQALITTTDPADIDADLRRKARPWRVVQTADGAAVVEGAS
jgi:DNA replication and repair protein RecF